MTIVDIRGFRKESKGGLKSFNCKSCMWFRFVESVYRFDKGFKCLHPKKGLSEKCPKTM